MTSFFGYIRKDEQLAAEVSDTEIFVDTGHFTDYTRRYSGKFCIYIKHSDVNFSIEEKCFENEELILCLNGNIFVSDKNPSSDKEHLTGVYELSNSQPEKLRGEFVFLSYNKIESRLCVYRDQFGTHPVYYTELPDILIFSSNLEELRFFSQVEFQIDDLWIADAITNSQSEKWRTQFSGIKRIPPGSFLNYYRNTEIISYWDLEENEDYKQLEFDEAAKLLRFKLDKAIRNRISRHEKLGSELSGGLDSSAITVLGNRIASEDKRSLIPFSHVLSEKAKKLYFPYKDEREFSIMLANSEGMYPHIFCDADGLGLLDVIKKNIQIQSGGSQQFYSMLSDTLYRKVSDHDIHLLLSGFGGDEGITSKGIGYLEELEINRDWDSLKLELTCYSRQKGSNRLICQIKFYLKRILPVRFLIFIRVRQKNKLHKRRYKQLAFSNSFGKQTGLKKRYFDRKKTVVFSSLRSRQKYRLMHEHISQRLEYSYFDAMYYGLKYAYPMLDVELLELYYSLPGKYKFKNGIGRIVFREAMKDVLPDKIRLRNDKSYFTIPTVYQRILSERQNISDFIERSRIQNEYHYINYDKLLKMLDKIVRYTEGQKLRISTPAFLNSLQILLLQEMERNGEFKSGIKC